VFTGGAGQGSSEVRSQACQGLGFLGVAIDEELNVKPAGDRILSPASSVAAVVVFETREDIETSRLVRQVQAGSPGRSRWLSVSTGRL
jgi:acetate kinase